MISKLWKSKGVKVWLFVSIPLILLFAIIFIISSVVPVIYNVFNMVMPGGGPRRLGAPAGRKSPRARAFFSVVCNTFDAGGRPA